MEDKKFKATIKQHYVYRKYLSSWTPEKSTTKGTIQCYRKEEKSTFPSGLMGVGLSKYFYELSSLTEIEKMMVVFLTQSKNPQVMALDPLFVLREITQLDIIQEIHRMVSTGEIVPNKSDVCFLPYIPQNYIEMKRQAGEEIQSQFELSGFQFLGELTQGKSEFFQDDENAMAFMSYLVMQYLRTAPMRERQKRAFSSMSNEKERFERNVKFCSKILKDANIPFNEYIAKKEIEKIDENLDFDKVYPYTLFALAVEVIYGVTVSHKPSLHIIESIDNINFITCDQPIINIHASPSIDDKISNLTFYYPLSPRYAVIIDFDKQTYQRECSAEQVLTYNQKIIEFALSQVYAIEVGDFRINGLIN
ncbi:DUF4238 domain-containing protein [Pectobacterium versatile]|uniref:DUF4238 domain-containing protein n=1 Tax=Pectobacterium versatile TaxID=2488639 RepID=UPI0038639E5A